MIGRAVGLGVLVGAALGWVVGEGVGPASAEPTGQNRMNNAAASHPVTHLRLVMDLIIREPREHRRTIINSSPARHAGGTYATVIVRFLGHCTCNDQDFRPATPDPGRLCRDFPCI
jgi:hypothetical protein